MRERAIRMGREEERRQNRKRERKRDQNERREGERHLNGESVREGGRESLSFLYKCCC